MSESEFKADRQNGRATYSKKMRRRVKIKNIIRLINNDNVCYPTE